MAEEEVGDVGDGVLEGGREAEAGGVDLEEEDLCEFLGGVGDEGEDVVDAAEESRVQLDEVVHVRVVVAGEDEDHVRGLHGAHEFLDGLLSEVVVAAAGEAVALVDEEDAPSRAVDDGLGLDGGVADVGPHQVGALDFHELAGLEDAEFSERLGQKPRHGRLSAARWPAEEAVRKLLTGLDPRIDLFTPRVEGEAVLEGQQLLLDLPHPDALRQFRPEIEVAQVLVFVLRRRLARHAGLPPGIQRLLQRLGARQVAVDARRQHRTRLGIPLVLRC
mmetsp:Transcript_23529/g.75501  ORF Transcript_23529/g.75501 Transcript_23529/m.75501 type:complete len:275 (-) Transcript_23529:219-1043(-)